MAKSDDRNGKFQILNDTYLNFLGILGDADPCVGNAESDGDPGRRARRCPTVPGCLLPGASDRFPCGIGGPAVITV